MYKEYYYQPQDNDIPAISYMRVRGMGCVHIGISVKVGSYYEYIGEEYGISHFLEHICFRGNKKNTYEEIRNNNIRMGGSLNAHTSGETTNYSITTTKENLKLCVSLLSDMVFNPVIDNNDIKAERDIILKEIAEHEGSNWSKLIEREHESSFPDAPFLHRILGTNETVNNISRHSLLEWHSKHYHLGNVCYVIVGDLDWTLVKDIIQKQTNNIKVYDENSDIIIPEPLYTIKSFSFDKGYDMVIMSSYDNLEETDEICMYRNLFNEWLGGCGISSKLHKEIRDNMGLVYSINSNYFRFTKTHQNFNINFVSKPDYTYTIIEEVKQILDGHRKGLGMSESEFDMFIDYTKNNLSIRYDEPRHVFEMLLNNAIANKDKYVEYLSYEERLKRIEGMNYELYMEHTLGVMDNYSIIKFTKE